MHNPAFAHDARVKQKARQRIVRVRRQANMRVDRLNHAARLRRKMIVFDPVKHNPQRLIDGVPVIDLVNGMAEIILNRSRKGLSTSLVLLERTFTTQQINRCVASAVRLAVEFTRK